MRRIGLLLFLILMVSACTASDDSLPTQLKLPATKTLIPTQAQALTTPTLPEVNTIAPATESASSQQAALPEPSETSTSQSAVDTQEADTISTATAVSSTPIVVQATDIPDDCNLQDDWDEYTVQRGDNLANIASRTGSTIDELTVANCLDNPNRLRAGQVLFVPNSPNTNADVTTVAVIPSPTIQDLSTTTAPSVSVSIKRTYKNEKGFAMDYPADWNLLDVPSANVTNTILTSFEYTLGDEIPQNRWTEDMVSVTITVFNDPTTDTLSTWTQRTLTQLEGASNISQVNAPEAFVTESNLSGQQIDYVSSDDSRVANIYFIINGHKVQLSIGGNIDLALPIIQSIELSEP